MAAEYHRRFDHFGGRVIFGALSRLVLKLSALIRGPGVTRTMCLEIIPLFFLGFRARHLANRGTTDLYPPRGVTVEEGRLMYRAGFQEEFRPFNRSQVTAYVFGNIFLCSFS